VKANNSFLSSKSKIIKYFRKNLSQAGKGKDAKASLYPVLLHWSSHARIKTQG